MSVTLTTAAKNAALNAVVDLIDVGSGTANIQIFDASNNELGTLPFSTPAFGSANAGSVSANPVTRDNSINTGLASSFKVFDKSGNEVFSGSVSGTNGGGDLKLSNINLVVGDSVSVSSFSMTI